MGSNKISISSPQMDDIEWRALKEPITSGWITQGPLVEEFEDQFAKRHNAKHAVAVTSCTTGLHLALLAMGIGPGDEVLVPSFTWVSTANAVCYVGAKPVFVDIEKETYNLDPNSLKENITDKTKAVIPVHLFGLPADIRRIKFIVPDKVKIIEDAACAVGASYQGRTVGAIGDMGVFSFHPRKTLTTGEGGMITTNSSGLAEHVRSLRNHGASTSRQQHFCESKPYILPDFNELGFNYRMTDFQGAIGLVQLGKLERFIEERKRWAAFYIDELSCIEWLKLPEEKAGYEHSWQSFVCYVDEQKSPQTRNQIMEELDCRGVSTRPGTQAVHMLGYYRKKFGIQPDDCPVAHDCYLHTMAIPLHNAMLDEHYQHVVESIKLIG